MSVLTLRPLAAFSVLGLVTFGIVSCKEDPLVKSVGVNMEVQVTLDAASGSPLTGTYSRELDPDTYAAVRDNRDKMENMTIGDISYSVSDLVLQTGAPNPKISGSWKIYPSDAPTEVTTVATISNVDLVAQKAAATKTVLTVGNDARARIVNMIQGKKKFTVVFDGTSTQANYSKLKFFIDGTMSVKI